MNTGVETVGVFELDRCGGAADCLEPIEFAAVVVAGRHRLGRRRRVYAIGLCNEHAPAWAVRTRAPLIDGIVGRFDEAKSRMTA